MFIKYKLNGYVNKFKCPLPPVSVIPKTSMYVCWKNMNGELGKKIDKYKKSNKKNNARDQRESYNFFKFHIVIINEKPLVT